MLNIKILTVGKLSTKHIRDLAADYETRIKKFAKMEIIEIKESSKNDINEIVKEEGKLILDKLDKNAYVITLEIEGKQLTSEQLAEKLEQLPVQGYSKINFVIGGSHGLSDEVKQKANFKLSFSKFTFPHGLFRIILLEQIYRGFTINAKMPYHK